MSTNGAFASYQEVIDLHTESDKVSVIGIHTPTNFVPHKMFGGFFKQFKKFKYNGCSVKLVPAARLPADPLQVSYEAGETTIDPRDMLNPLMFHGCHGNDLGMILNKLYSINTVSGSDGIYLDNGVDMWQATQFDADGPLLESLYYKALTDNTWKKAHPQRGFRKAGLRPLVYQLATNVQFDGAHAWQSGGDYGEFYAESGMPIPSTDSNTGDVWDITSSVRDNMRVFTPKLTSLGWMDTYNVLTTGKFKQVDVSDATDADEANAMINDGLFDVLKSQESMATLPRIYMGVILLPPAYKTEQYFRMIVTHHFSFKQFRGISFSNDIMETPAYSNWNDVDDATEDSSDPTDPDTPGGGGDNPEPGPDNPDNPDEPIVYSGAYVSSLSMIGTDPVYLELYDTVNDSPVLLATFIGDNENGNDLGIFTDENMIPHPVLRQGTSWYVWKNDPSRGLGWWGGVSTLPGALASNNRVSLDWNYQSINSLITYASGDGVQSRVQQICNGSEVVQVLPNV